MTPATLLRHRLHNQRLAATRFENPADPVRWLGAVQALVYLGSLWAIGLRTRAATEKVVERAIAERAILRTWSVHSSWGDGAARGGGGGPAVRRIPGAERRCALS